MADHFGFWGTTCCQQRTVLEARDRTVRKEDEREVMIVGKDTVMVRKRYDRSTKASPKEQAVVIAASELNRLRALDALRSRKVKVTQGLWLGDLELIEATAVPCDQHQRWI